MFLVVAPVKRGTMNAISFGCALGVFGLVAYQVAVQNQPRWGAATAIVAIVCWVTVKSM